MLKDIFNRECSNLLQTKAYCKGLTRLKFLSKHTQVCMWPRTGHGFQKGISRATERIRLFLSERFHLYHSFPSVSQKYGVTCHCVSVRFRFSFFFTCPTYWEANPKNNGSHAPRPSPFHKIPVSFSIYNELAYINRLFKETFQSAQETLSNKR